MGMESEPSNEGAKELVAINILGADGTLYPTDVEVVSVKLARNGVPESMKYKVPGAGFGTEYRADWRDGGWVAEPMD